MFTEKELADAPLIVRWMVEEATPAIRFCKVAIISGIGYVCGDIIMDFAGIPVVILLMIWAIGIGLFGRTVILYTVRRQHQWNSLG